jgi:hypothetical protein
MTKTIENLLKNSGLPGPRGNLPLLYAFAHHAAESEINECLSFYNEDVSNSPEEFVVMCGIAGYCILKQGHMESVMEEIRRYASHKSWRIREAVAIGIQEIAEGRMEETLDCLGPWLEGNELEKRAAVAALCEPKLLKEKSAVVRILDILSRLTLEFESIDAKLPDRRDTLRKALGYGWSVVIVSLPEEGKSAFEKIAGIGNRHIRWIVKENLKKNRLLVMDKEWVGKMLAKIV